MRCWAILGVRRRSEEEKEEKEEPSKNTEPSPRGEETNDKTRKTANK